MIHIEVLSKPIPKARPRFNRFSGRTYTPKSTQSFESLISSEARKKFIAPIEGPVTVKIVFNFIKAKSNKSDMHIIRPDLDNLVKGVLDGLNEIAFKDDCQVNRLSCEKNYSTKESVEIFISATPKETRQE